MLRGLMDKLTRWARLRLSPTDRSHPRYPTRRGLPQAKPGRVQLNRLSIANPGVDLCRVSAILSETLVGDLVVMQARR